MRFRILGPLVVSGAAVTAGRDRIVLSMLLLDAGHVVTADVLVEALWDGEPPPTARNQVQRAVSRLRTVLGIDMIFTDPAGYGIRVGPADLDALAFTDHVQRSRALAGVQPAQAQALLRTGLDMWRGRALAGAGSRLLQEYAAALDEQRAGVIEEWADAEIALNGGAQLVGELTGLVGQFPLRERLRGLLMLALCGAGRQADALAEFRRTRRLLIEELGIEPGTELQAVHHRVLAGGPVDGVPAVRARSVPRELPPPPVSFTARELELARLDALLSGQIGAAAVISAVSGTAGIGKTTLAVYWGHRVAARFPDGQLYVNLHGFDPGGVVTPALDALRGLLVSLGVPARAMPTDVDGLAALYRSQLAGRRMLVVLDNARDVGQVRPLLPAAPGCVAVVTSRSQLTGLVAMEGAELISLDLLSLAQSREVLASRLGSQWLAREPVAADRIVAACSRLPLALVIVASLAVSRPGRSLAVLADDLEAARLDTLSTDDPAADARSVFLCSYRALTPGAAVLFRLLGLYPGADFTVAVAATLLGVSGGEARAVLDELSSAHLVADRGAGRYGLHDLLRAYACELTGRYDEGELRRAALRRLYDYFVHNARQATTAVSAYTLLPADFTPGAGVVNEPLAHPDDGLAWLRAHRDALISAVQVPALPELDGHVWMLAHAVGQFLETEGSWKGWAATTATGMAAADRLGDDSATAVLANRYGYAMLQLGDWEVAETYHERAGVIFRRLGDRGGIAEVESHLGVVRYYAGAFTEALDHFERAMAEYTALGNRVGQAEMLHNFAAVQMERGDHRRAVSLGEQALELIPDTASARLRAGTLDTIGVAYHHIGDYAAAIHHIGAAVHTFSLVGDRYHHAACLVHLGDSQRAHGDPAAARSAYLTGLALYEKLDHADAHHVRQLLSTLSP